MKPRAMPTLEGEAAEAFIEQDKKPLTDEQKKFLKECHEIYRKNPIKLYLAEKK